ncbi:MAG: hypothetical protein ACMUEL_07605 [Flavobacteriales bacterium Tduv]
MILDASIIVSSFVPKGTPSYVVEDRKERVKTNQSKKKKSKKRYSTRSRHSRKMSQEIR